MIWLAVWVYAGLRLNRSIEQSARPYRPVAVTWGSLLTFVAVVVLAPAILLVAGWWELKRI